MSKDLDKNFVAAIKKGDIDMATKLLSVSGLSDRNTWFSLFYLFCDILPTSKNILELLLSQASDEALTKIFRAAIDYDRHNVVNLIMKERPIVGMRAFKENGNTAFHISVQPASEGIVKSLLYKVPDDINATNEEESSSLHLIAINDDEGIAFHLMDAGVDCNKRDQFGRTALHTAAIHRNKELTEQLIAYGANVNIISDDNLTPLECAPQSVLIRTHVIAMKALNMYVCNKNLRYVDLAGRDRPILEYYRKGIEDIKTKRIIGGRSISYYRFLTCGLNRLASYAENDKLMDAVNRKSKRLVWYKGFLYQRMKLAEKRKGLLSRSLKSFEIAVSAVFGKALHFYLTWEITDYLSNEDLENLIKAAPSGDCDS